MSNTYRKKPGGQKLTPKKEGKQKPSNRTQSTRRESPVLRAQHQMVCLFTVRQTLSNLEKDMNDTLNTFVHLIEEGWQYPSITCSRVILANSCFQSVNFVETPWKISTDIVTSEGTVGRIDVCYLEQRKQEHEGPFLLQERVLINTLAAEISEYIERVRAKRLQHQQQRELELYASLLRHDLKNDLSVILSSVDLLQMITKGSDPIVGEALSSIEAVSERMMNLLKLLGKPADDVERNISSLVRTACKRAEEANASMEVQVIVDPNAESLRIGESRLLPAVFDNLLRNAAKYAGPAPIVEIHISMVGTYAQVVVSDNGPGIAESIRDRLFEKGVSTSGGGLGLYLSREVVNAMGGTLELVEPEEGRGATFIAKIPVAI